MQGEKCLISSIQAHDSDIGALTVNPEGTLSASASVSGKVIKIFHSDSGELLQNLRRGSKGATITSIVFHPALPIIACASDRESIHLFEIQQSAAKCAKSGETDKQESQKNAKSSLGFLKVFSDHFDSDLCLAKIKVEESLKTIGFDAKSNSLTVMSNDRTLYFFKIPASTVRYVEEAEIRTY